MSSLQSKEIRELKIMPSQFRPFSPTPKKGGTIAENPPNTWRVPDDFKLAIFFPRVKVRGRKESHGRRETPGKFNDTLEIQGRMPLGPSPDPQEPPALSPGGGAR